MAARSRSTCRTDRVTPCFSRETGTGPRTWGSGGRSTATQFAWGNDPVAGGLQSDTRYRLRYRVTQDTPNTTLLQARVWPENEAEPAAWTIEAFDDQPELQNTAGSFAIDIYNYSGFGHIFIDDLEINEYPVPSAAEVIPPPGGFGLSAPRPHPVVGSATIDVTVDEDTGAELFVFDVSGRLVARPFFGRLVEGTTSISWNPACPGCCRPESR